MIKIDVIGGKYNLFRNGCYHTHQEISYFSKWLKEKPFLHDITIKDELLDIIISYFEFRKEPLAKNEIDYLKSQINFYCGD